MCTVTYIPLEKDRFVLTSNRDEEVKRPTKPLASYLVNGKQLYFPMDERAGGTWIAASESGRYACLLNGAYQYFDPTLKFKVSRGKVLVDVLTGVSATSTFEQSDLTDVAPFTLIIIDHANQITLHEMRWDGEQKHLKTLNANENHIWCSATLYTEEDRNNREQWFAEWLKDTTNQREDKIMDFHQSKHDVAIDKDLVMNKNNFLKTVSVTRVVGSHEEFHMKYLDLINANNSNELKVVKSQYA